MYLFTDKITNKIDTYVYIFCSNYKKTLKNIEIIHNIKIDKSIYKRFEDNKDLLIKLYINNSVILLGSIKKCDTCNINNIIKDVCTIIRNDNSIKNILYYIIPISDFYINYQIVKFIYYLYNFNKYKSDNDIKKKVYFFSYQSNKNIINKSIKNGRIVNNARDLINEPANMLTPLKFIIYLKKNINSNIRLTIYDSIKLRNLNMNLIYSVGKGSKRPPYLAILKYLHNKNEKPIVLIGKGITFDTGGISLKRGDFHDMKTDMTGASVVYSLLMLASTNKLSKNIIGMIPLAENMVGQNAIIPGDIITAHNKKTVEITNTDAEGRLILADCLSYCSKFNPKYIIDIATLTGQAGSIFNDMAIVVLGNNNKLINKYKESCSITNESVWELPLWKKYDKLLESSVADIKNSNAKAKAGTILGGTFLKYFVPKNAKWMHVDIAGVSYDEDNKLINGATGVSILSLFDLIQSY